jgi:hypothetical protein
LVNDERIDIPLLIVVYGILDQDETLSRGDDT